MRRVLAGPSRRARAHVRRALGILVLLGAGALVGLIVVPIARAAGTPIQVIVHPSGANPAFGSGATGPLLDTRSLSALGPGGSVSGVMAVRNNSGDSATLTLQLANLTTCPPGTSSPCAATGAALADALRFEVQVADQPFAPGVSTTDQNGMSVTALQSGVTLADPLPDQGVRWVRLTVSLPYASTGNGVQFGAVGFDLQLNLSGIASETIGPGSGGSGGASGSGGVLASTGVRVALLGGLAGALLLIGGVLLLAGRRKGASSQK